MRLNNETVKVGNELVLKSDILKWIEALRSGRYKQTVSRLQDKAGYCCLGVLCDIIISDDDKKKDMDYKQLFGSSVYDQPKAPKWMKHIARDFHESTGRSLIIMNDNRKYNFNEIADLLEAVYILEVLS